MKTLLYICHEISPLAVFTIVGGEVALTILGLDPAARIAILMVAGSAVQIVSLMRSRH